MRFADFSWGTDENTPAIPWAEIVERPHHYFDTSLYQLPCALNAPDKLKSNPLDIFSLHQFFLLGSLTSLPFQFRSKHEIMQRTSVVVNELDDSDDDDLPSRVVLSSTLSATTTLPTLHPTQSSPIQSAKKPQSESEVPQSMTQCANLDQPGDRLIPPATSNLSITDQSSSTAKSGPETMASMRTNVTSVNPPEVMKRTGKKGKGHPKQQSVASTKVRQVLNDAVDSSIVEPLASTRKSGRAAKRKLADKEVVPLPEKSEPSKKKKRLQDRWFYEPIVPGQP